ncbi:MULTISPECIES: LysR family transcriptional regulator substrate-binding protein [unclassified Oscillibacter]|uniref:LysR family transcriptional regulator substrate-binding protein n=1 Tax=unclassified Oscillibacter TaxID=2629304 RepID=UPI0025F73229|nr:MULTISPECIES: LysR family transcriptional regulator substrate-binding protein [unclassified Oscillibacter]
MYEALCQVKSLERNLREDRGGEITLGTTEGRFRILMPNLISDFKNAFPDVHLRIVSAASPELQEMVLNNRLDMMVVGMPGTPSRFLTSTVILQEKLYLVVNDNMLRQYFPELYPACKQIWLTEGAVLRNFQQMPFALNLPYFNSSMLLKRHLEKIGASLDCVHVSSHPDLHHMMSTRDYTASFCLTMYLPGVLKLNQERKDKLNIFPIKDFHETNPVVVSYLQSRVFRRSTQMLLQMIRRNCKVFSKYDLIYQYLAQDPGPLPRVLCWFIEKGM